MLALSSLSRRSLYVGLAWVGIWPVSYTHLDVYKRQGLSIENLRKILRVGEFKPGLTDSYEDSYRETWHLNWPNIAALAVWLLSVGTLLTHAVRNRKLLPAPPLMIDPDLSK